MDNKRGLADTYVSIPSAAIYYRVNRALASGDFNTDGRNQWPTADLTNAKKTIKAHAQLRPFAANEMQTVTNSQLEGYRQRMLTDVLSLSDETVDVLDLCLHIWMRQLSLPGDWSTVSVDQVLRLRGLSRQSLKQSSRDAVVRQLEILQNLWLTVFEMDVPETVLDKCGRKRTVFKSWRGESRALHIDARFGPIDGRGQLQSMIYRLKPGEILARYIMGPGRQTALMSQKALTFAADKYWPEKRLCRFLAYQWRCRVSHYNFIGPFKVRTILENIQMGVDDRRPNQTKLRLETAMQRLIDSRVIRSFQYAPAFDDTLVGKKGWRYEWLESLIEVEPPEFVQDHYTRKESDLAQRAIANGNEQTQVNLCVLLKEARKRRGFSQSVAAGQLQITTTWFCLIERGAKQPSRQLEQQILAWIETNLESGQDAWEKI